MNQSQSQTPFDGTFLVFLVAIGFVIGEGVATDLAGQLASLAFGAHHVVPGGIGSGAMAFLRLWSHPGDPKLAWGPRARGFLPGPVAMWAALAVTELLLVATAIVAIRLIRRAQSSLGGLGGNTAKVGRAEVERRMGRKAVERHTVAIFGSSAAAVREPVAIGVDVATGTRLFARSEDYILALGVPRVGKGEGFVIPSVLRHKGPTVVTATRHDTYVDTISMRAACGPVYVFDPQALYRGLRSCAGIRSRAARYLRWPSSGREGSPDSPGSDRRWTVVGTTGSRWQPRSSAAISTRLPSRAWASTVSLRGRAAPEQVIRSTFFPATRGLRVVGAKILLPPPGWSHDIETRSGPPCVGRSIASLTPRCWRPLGSTTTRSMQPSS